MQTEMQELGFMHIESLEEVQSGGAYYFNIGVQKMGTLKLCLK